jgi:hypothetical protein
MFRTPAVRRIVDVPPENGREMSLRAKPDAERDIRDGRGRRGKQRLGVLDAPTQDERMG